MPELHLQRRERVPTWAWALAVLGAALLIWWFARAAMPGPTAGVMGPQERVAGERQVMSDETGDASLPIEAIVLDPGRHMGQTVTGTAIIADMPSKNGMWLEAEGRRMFAVIDGATPDSQRLREGQVVRLAGEVADESRIAELPGVASLRPDTLAQLNEQPAFLHVDGERIEVMGPDLTGRAAE